MDVAKACRRLIFLSLGSACVLCLPACGRGHVTADYQSVPLVRGSRSFGMPLAGIAIDPTRRDVFAIVGGGGRDHPANFYILWKGTDGTSYCVTLCDKDKTINSITEISPGGKCHSLIDMAHPAPGATVERAEIRTVSGQEAVNSIMDALPVDSGFRSP